jgi:hypothetical protein
MSPSKPKTSSPEPARPEAAESLPQSEKRPWETPRMEEVSEQVMAQPYIRFT